MGFGIRINSVFFIQFQRSDPPHLILSPVILPHSYDCRKAKRDQNWILRSKKHTYSDAVPPRARGQWLRLGEDENRKSRSQNVDVKTFHVVVKPRAGEKESWSWTFCVIQRLQDMAT